MTLLTSRNTLSSMSRRSFIAAGAATAVLAGTASKGLFAQGNRSAKPLQVGMVVYDGFQLLDTFGPLEMFGDLDQQAKIFMIAEKMGSVKSGAGPSTLVDVTLTDAPPLDVLIIPGGRGTWVEVKNEPFLSSFKVLADRTAHVASVCTGSAILARAGLLDGVRATTNKRAFDWVTTQGPKTQWIKKARWVEEGKYFTSSGVSAGTDMALALIAKIYDTETARRVAKRAEYSWMSDSTNDLFSAVSGS